MEKIKQSNIIGTFYPKSEKEIRAMVNNFKKSPYPDDFKTRAIIAPHAGYIYSGELAYKSIALLDSNIENIFIFAPAHRMAFQGIATTSYDFFKTPLGKVETNRKTIEELKEKFQIQELDEALEFEHAIEVQLPIIQLLFENKKIIPLLVGAQNYKLISEIIENYYPDNTFGFIISSDLSHFLTDDEAKKIDNLTAEMIETKNLTDFSSNQACGAVGIAGLVDFAIKKDFSFIRIGMLNSSHASNDKTRVVGYGAWALYEKDNNEFLKKYYSDFILNLVRQAIITKNGTIDTTYPEIFNSSGASFVTLEKQGRLRGCIGSIIAHRPLYMDLIENARASAYFDPRFNPLEKNETAELQIAVSILSKPVQMNFESEDDLLNKIVPHKDGLIISDLGKRAVYLPSVWEQLPDKKEFLNSLKLKAGLAYNHFSKTFEAYRFYTTYIK